MRISGSRVNPIPPFLAAVDGLYSTLRHHDRMADQRSGHGAVTPPAAGASAVRPRSAEEQYPFRTERVAAGLRGRLLLSSGPIVPSPPAAPSASKAPSPSLQQAQERDGGGCSDGSGGTGESAGGGSGGLEASKYQP